MLIIWKKVKSYVRIQIQINYLKAAFVLDAIVINVEEHLGHQGFLRDLLGSHGWQLS